jgi:hypothetical protein
MRAREGSGRETGEIMARTQAVRVQGQRLTKAERKAAQDLFLQAFRLMGNVRAACQQAKVSRQTFYEWCESDTEFAQRYKDAEEDAMEYLEAEAFRRAVTGIEKPVISRGEVVYDKDDKMVMTKEYSDPLLALLLKARNPQKYRERPPSVEVNTQVTVTEHKERLLDKLRALPEPTLVDADVRPEPAQDTTLPGETESVDG